MRFYSARLVRAYALSLFALIVGCAQSNHRNTANSATVDVLVAGEARVYSGRLVHQGRPVTGTLDVKVYRIDRDGNRYDNNCTVNGKSGETLEVAVREGVYSFDLRCLRVGPKLVWTGLGDFSETSDVMVVPAAVDTITLTPSKNNVPVGTEIPIRAKLVDAFQNPVGGVTLTLASDRKQDEQKLQCPQVSDISGTVPCAFAGKKPGEYLITSESPKVPHPGSAKINYLDANLYVAITAPNNGVDFLTNQARQQVSGTCSKNVKNLKTSLGSFQDGDCADGTFALKTLTLTEGQNTVTITGDDGAGNETSDTLVITLDTQSPDVAITAPNGGKDFATHVRDQQLSGTCTGDVVTVVSSRGTVETQACATDGTWSLAVYTLSRGPNTFTITATDAAGNSSTASQTITYDDIPPSIAVTAPNGGKDFTTKQQIQTVSGTCSKDVTVIITTLGTFRDIDCARTQTWSLEPYTLSEGQNTFTVTAEDVAGNQAADAITITYTKPDPYTVSISDSSAGEGDGTISMTIALNQPADGAGYSVDFMTQDASALAYDSGNPDQPYDYFSASGTLSFGSGEQQKQVTISINDDDLPESNEIFHVVLSNAVNAKIVKGDGAATIIDDDKSTCNANDFGGVEDGFFLVTTPDHFNNIRKCLSASFKLTNNISLSKFPDWEPIGRSLDKDGQPAPKNCEKGIRDCFSGLVQGNGYTIGGLKVRIEQREEKYEGLFGSNYGVLRNFTVTQPKIGRADGAGEFFGAIAGWNGKNGTIQDVRVSRFVVTDDDPNDSAITTPTDINQANNFGGFVGFNAGRITDPVLDGSSSFTTGIYGHSTAKSVGGITAQNGGKPDEGGVYKTAAIVGTRDQGCAVGTVSQRFKLTLMEQMGGIAGVNYSIIDRCNTVVDAHPSQWWQFRDSHDVGRYIGGISGINRGAIRNATADIHIVLDHTEDKNWVAEVGGIAGAQDDSDAVISVIIDHSSAKLTQDISNAGELTDGNGACNGSFVCAGGLLGSMAGKTAIQDSSADISATVISRHIGGLVGVVRADQATITRSHANVDFKFFHSDYWVSWELIAIGGLVGETSLTGSGGISISESYSTGNIGPSGSGTGYGYTRVGGIIGLLSEGTTVSDVYSTVSIKRGRDGVGGIIGFMYDKNATSHVKNAYFRGSITEPTFVEKDDQDGNTYLDADEDHGGVFGIWYQHGRVTERDQPWDCRVQQDPLEHNAPQATFTLDTATDQLGWSENYWGAEWYTTWYGGRYGCTDWITSGIAGVNVMTKDQMATQDTFASQGWDFQDVWQMSRDGYPILRNVGGQQ